MTCMQYCPLSCNTLDAKLTLIVDFHSEIALTGTSRVIGKTAIDASILQFNTTYLQDRVQEVMSTFVQRKVVDFDSRVVGQGPHLIVPCDVGKGIASGYAGEEYRVANGYRRAPRSYDNLCWLSWEEGV